MSSPNTDILLAVKAVVEALNIDGMTVTVRKHPLVGEKDPLPMCVIAPLPETVEDETSENIILMRYPVQVRVAYDGNQLLESNITRVLDARHSIRLALHKPGLFGADTVINTNIDPKPQFDTTAYLAELDVSDMLFYFTSEEARSA